MIVRRRVMAVVLLLVHVGQTNDTPVPKKKKLDVTEKVMEKAVSVLSSIQENTGKQKTNVTEEAEDEDLAFARHISNELTKNSDARSKTLVKIKIQQLIFEAQFQCPAISTTSSQQTRSVPSYNGFPSTQMRSFISTHYDQY
jgi:hypothetical protein